MAANEGVDAGVAELNLTTEENRMYRQLFRQADSDSVGVVTGEVAVPFFEKTRLDSRILGEIWHIADQENRGFLTFAGFAIVLRLIGHTQAGRQPTRELAAQPSVMPRFDGYTPAPVPPSPAAPTPAATAAAPVPLTATATGGGRIPPLTPERVAQFSAVFERQPLQQPGGALPGDQARQIFLKSGLPGETLHKIWQLADTEQRGSLVLTEFVIAMHLLSSMKSGALRTLPGMLPAALYEAATRRPGPAITVGPVGVGGLPGRQSPMTTGNTGIVTANHNTGMAAPAMPIPRQMSGQRTGSPLGGARRPPLGPQSTGVLTAAVTGTGTGGDGGPGGDWVITAPDKARFDQIYAELDRDGRGYIAGEEAVGFLRQSNLPEAVLASIWDLSDINQDGCLNRDEFAVAMYLIRQQRSGQQQQHNQRAGDGILPATLPPNLVPPSMRAPPQLRPQPTSSVFDAPPPQAQALSSRMIPPQSPQPQQQQQQPQPIKPLSSSAMDDLFGLDAGPPPHSSSPPPAQPQIPLSTGGSDPFAVGTGSPRPLTATATAVPTATSSFRPFMASSSFGRGLSSQLTGESAGSVPRQLAPTEDLLGDTDPEVSRKLTSETAELANLSNQVGSLSRQMAEVQAQRTAAQSDLTQASTQKKNFEQRLAQLRGLYEKEAQDARSLAERLSTARTDTLRIQAECLQLEAQLRDAQDQHRQVVTDLQADQQENASLRDRIRAAGSELALVRAQLDKVRSEGRQQRGLVAINKKQLSTAEGERDRLRGELSSPLSATGAERTGSPISISTTHVVASPTASASANNPFFRRAGSTDAFATTTIVSPKPTADVGSSSSSTAHSKAIEDMFGPSPFGSTGTPPPPLTSFSRQNTGASSGGGSVGSGAFSTPPATATSRQPEQQQQHNEIGTSSLFSAFPDRSERPRTASEHTTTNSMLHNIGSGTSLSGSRAPSPLTTRSVGAESAPAAPDTGIGSGLDGFAASADSAKAKADFEKAFASFTRSKKSHDSLPGAGAAAATPTAITAPAAGFGPAPAEPGPTEPGGGGSDITNKTFAAFSSEFPPIRELDQDDSESDEEKAGFDDDFGSASPPPTGQSRFQSLESGLESHNASDTVTPRPASPTPASSSHDDVGDHDDHGDRDPFGTATPRNPTVAASATPTSHLDKNRDGNDDDDANDDDDEFDGLEDAKEGSAADHDDFASVSRSGLADDFNAVFDGSPSASQGRSDANTTGSFDMVTPTKQPTVAQQKSSPQQLQLPHDGSGSGSGSGHDWDSIFAELDSAPAPTKMAEEDVGGGAGGSVSDHDHPAVINLTGMGYGRSDAVLALEKYDYDLERAADHLANQS